MKKTLLSVTVVLMTGLLISSCKKPPAPKLVAIWGHFWTPPAGFDCDSVHPNGIEYRVMFRGDYTRANQVWTIDGLPGVKDGYYCYGQWVFAVDAGIPAQFQLDIAGYFSKYPNDQYVVVSHKVGCTTYTDWQFELSY